jgi:hypothetical protein
MQINVNVGDKRNMDNPVFPSESEVKKVFEDFCSELGIQNPYKEIENLVIYELTDGTRTSTDLNGWEAYFDGGIFIMRLVYLLNKLGCRNGYVLTTGDSHKSRDNYQDIIHALTKEVGIYEKFIRDNDIRLRFIGKLRDIKYPGAETFVSKIKDLEKESLKNKGFTLHVLIDYSTEWANQDPEFKELPNANVIVKHTKGQVNEGLWLPGKLNGNSFVYVQNASVNRNWSDRELICLIAVSLRSMIIHKGLQFSKKYNGNEAKAIKKIREEKLPLVHRQFSNDFKKRIVMFSNVGPEIYEF